MLLGVLPLITACSSSKPAPSGGSVSKIDRDGKTIFQTTVKQCEVKSYTPSIATSRELLVGFDSLQISEQGLVTIGQKELFQTKATAILDAIPIEVVTLTQRDHDCVKDFIFWRKTSEAVGSLTDIAIDVTKDSL